MIKSGVLFEIGVKVHSYVERYEELRAKLAITPFYFCPYCHASDGSHNIQCTTELRGADFVLTPEQIEHNKNVKKLQIEFKNIIPNAVQELIDVITKAAAEYESKGDEGFRRALVLELIRESNDWQDAVKTAFSIEKEVRKRENGV